MEQDVTILSLLRNFILKIYNVNLTVPLTPLHSKINTIIILGPITHKYLNHK